MPVQAIFDDANKGLGFCQKSLFCNRVNSLKNMREDADCQHLSGIKCVTFGRAENN